MNTRGALLAQAPDLVPEVGAALRVEPGGGLVEEEQLRLVDQAQPEVEAARRRWPPE
jgi:hypothetical protein